METDWFSYNKYGHLTKRSYRPAEGSYKSVYEYKYTYDKGKRKSVKIYRDGKLENECPYDSNGFLKKEYSVTYTWDKNGYMKSWKSGGETTDLKYTFYSNGMVKTMEYSPGKNHKVTYKYNKKGLLTERINGAVTESVKYNYSNGLVSKITYHENDEESTEVYKITYSKQKVDAKKYAAIMSNLALWNSMNFTYYESLYVK